VPTCVSANARAQAAEIASRAPIVKQAVEAGRIAVVPAVYEIETGIVSLI
jgi:carbonic anhydrase